ncbi:MAG: MFS transporter [Steroidobacteraceae bacterium]
MAQSRFYGWKLLTAFWWIVFINLGFAAYGTPVMNAGMAVQLHLSRTMAGLPYSMYTWMSAVPSVLVAVLIRRFGVRLTVMFGCLLVIAGCVLMGTVVDSGLTATLVIGILIAFGVCAGGVFGTQPGLVLWFERRRALAISILYAGGATGGIFAARLLNRVITAAGGNWRAGWWLFAALAALACVLAAVFIREKPSDLGQQPDGRPASPPLAPGAPEGSEPAPAPRALASFITREVWTLPQVLRSPKYWILVLALAGGSAGYTLFLAQGVLHLKDLGFTTTESAYSISVMTLVDLVAGKAALAVFGDRFDPRYIWAVSAAAFGAGFLLLVDPRSMASVYAFSACIGLGFGAGIVCVMAVVSNYFGTEVFAAAAGIAAGLNTTIAFGVSVLGGLVYDRLHTYAPTFYTLAVWCFAGAIVLALMRPPRQREPRGAAVAVSGA